MTGTGDQNVTGSSPIATGESFHAGGIVGLQTLSGASPIASGESFYSPGVVAGPITGNQPIDDGGMWPGGEVFDDAHGEDEVEPLCAPSRVIGFAERLVAECGEDSKGGGIGDEDDRGEQGSMSGTWGHETTTRRRE